MSRGLIEPGAGVGAITHAPDYKSCPSETDVLRGRLRSNRLRAVSLPSDPIEETLFLLRGDLRNLRPGQSLKITRIEMEGSDFSGQPSFIVTFEDVIEDPA